MSLVPRRGRVCPSDWVAAVRVLDAPLISVCGAALVRDSRSFAVSYARSRAACALQRARRRLSRARTPRKDRSTSGWATSLACDGNLVSVTPPGRHPLSRSRCRVSPPPGRPGRISPTSRDGRVPNARSFCRTRLSPPRPSAKLSGRGVCSGVTRDKIRTPRGRACRSPPHPPPESPRPARPARPAG